MVLLIGAISMTLDHVGLLWGVPWLRVVGRLAFPLFAYQVVVSYHHASSVPRYAGRLLLFAIVSQPVYSLLCPGSANVLFLFSAAVCILRLRDSLCASSLSTPYSYSAFAVCIATVYLLLIRFKVDYGAYGLLVIWLVEITRSSKPQMILAYVVLTGLSSIFGFVRCDQIFGVLSFLLPLERFKRISIWKYSYYFFYPAHILALTTVRNLISLKQ